MQFREFNVRSLNRDYAPFIMYFKHEKINHFLDVSDYIKTTHTMCQKFKFPTIPYESVQVSNDLVRAQNASVYGESISQSTGFEEAESTLGKM